jgi:hypothetical protein
LKKKQNKSVDHIRKVKSRVEQKLLKMESVNGVGVGVKFKNGKPTGEIGITIFVDKKRDDIPAKERIPRQIYGIKTDVRERKGYVIPHADEFDKRYNPLFGGACVGPARRVANNQIMKGTLGAIVIDTNNGQPMILSSYHVLAVDKDWPNADRTILQPPNEPDRTVALLTQAILNENEGVDAAVANISNSVGLAHAIADIGPTNGSASATPNTRVIKRGAATQLTHGTIMHTNVQVGVDYSSYGLGKKIFLNQMEIHPDESNGIFSEEGDSGSAIVEEQTGRTVGLLLGGFSDSPVVYANHIENILNHFHIKIP